MAQTLKSFPTFTIDGMPSHRETCSCESMLGLVSSYDSESDAELPWADSKLSMPDTEEPELSADVVLCFGHGFRPDSRLRLRL